MNALSKKLCGALLAVISAVCLAAGIFFTVRLNVSAETSVVLGDAKYYEISGGTCAGLSAEGENIASAEKNVVLQIPDGVTTIGMSAFKDCAGVTEIIIPDTVQEINTGAFSGCVSLSKINLPEGLTDINSRLFSNCSSLFSITIPASVNYLGSSVFSGCNRLIEIYNKSSVTIDNTVVPSVKNVYTADGGSKLREADADGFVFYADESKPVAEIYLLDYTGAQPDPVLPADYNGKSYAIFNDAFKGDDYLTGVTFPENAKITAIGDYAFYGCSEITGITLPKTVSALGNYAFYGCSSLQTVTFNENEISVLSASVFEKCSSLKTIDVPASVSSLQSGAFKGCSSLESVTFNKYIREVGTVIEEYLLETIYSSAFEGCRSLKIMEIPETVKNIQRYAFAGCTNLQTVYLPEAATFGDEVFDSFNCPVLIAPDDTAYAEYETKLAGYSDSLTYKIELTLVYGGENYTDYRLYNLDYRYVLQEDGKIWAQNGGMPVQEGYKTSVWYSNSSYSVALKVDGAKLNTLLRVGGDITLYAKTVEKPSLTAAAELVYDTEEISYAEAVGWTSDLEADCNISISGYVPYIGTEELPEIIKDAGVYTLGITLKEELGEWDAPCEVLVTVARAKTDIAKFHWVNLIDNGDGSSDYSELASTDSDKPYIYLYADEEGNTVPYLDEDPSKKPVSDPKRVITSYLFYSGKPHTIVLREDENYGGDLQVNYVSGYSATQSGVYTVKAEIPADNNYIFDFTNDEDAILRGLGVSGQIITGSDKITLSKTWYIVSATSNGLVIGGSPYTVPSVWTYRGGAFNAPDVNFGEAENLVTFTLSRKDLNAGEFKLVCGNMPYSEFGNVINDSIPVGDYELTISIKDYTNEKGTTFAGSTQTFEFTVMNAVYHNEEGLKLENILGFDEVSEVRYSPSVKFAEISGWDELAGKELHDKPSAPNIWSGSDYKNYYGGFEVYYYVISKTGNSGGYYTFDDYAGKTENKPKIIPNAVGVYTVYYRVSAPGYVSLSGDYSLIVYDELDIEDIQNEVNGMNVVYNGETRKPNLDTDIYRAVYLDDESNPEVKSAMAALGIEQTYAYIDAGAYPIALTVREAHYVESQGCYLYRWSGAVNPADVYAEISFNIEKAENNTRTLSVTEWHWNSYDPVKNKISWTTDWVADESQFTFELVSSDGSGKKYSFAEFAKADSGFYTLVAICPEGLNYKEGRAERALFISPAEVIWQTAPYIESWKYGDFDKMFSLPEPVLVSAVGAIQEEVIENAYFRKNGSAAKYASVEDLTDENGELPAGKYSLVYFRAAQGNYGKLDYTVNFQVLKADNYWDVTPVVYGWEYGDKSIDYLTYKPEYAPHYGDAKKVVIQYRMLDDNNVSLSGWEYTLADLGLDEYGKLNVGNYEIKATMSGSDDYESMEFSMRFKVVKAQNSWDEIPNVISWNAGRIKSIEEVLSVVPANGTVVITITDKNGKIIIEDELPENINVNKLKSLGAGAYVLKAYVGSSDRFEELVAYVDFAVFEDTVSQTAIIALTIVFAVVAIALAIVGVVLLNRRDKMIEAEFRKMIKSELNRR